MADVSVEFGAKDVGLQESLKKIQSEMQSLEGKVKSGELSFEELESAMKRLSQVERLEKQLQAIGNASDESSPKIKKLGDDIDSAGSRAQSAAEIFDAEFQKIAGAFTVGNLAAQGFQKIIELAFEAARQVVQGFSDAIDLGGRLDDLSKRTGETAGKLLLLENAFVEAGLSADQVGAVINKLQNFMVDAANGGDRQRAAMAALGISMSELEAKTPTEQMGVFARAISGIQDPTARAAAASEIFGEKLGGKLLPLLTEFDPALQNARDTLGSLEEVMDKNAATFAAAGDTIDRVKGKMAAFAAGILSETIPALGDLGKSMEQVDAAGLGETIGKILSPALRDFTRDLQIISLVFDEITKKFGDLGSAIFGGAENFKEISKEANNYLQVLAALLPSGLNPVNLAVKGLAENTKDLSSKTDTAAASIAGTGTAAQTAAARLKNIGTASGNAAGKVDDLGTSAQDTGQNIASAFSLTSDFAPKLDEISGSWGGVNDQILGGKNLLSDSYNLADSITGKIDEQVIGFGGVNEQLTTSKDLSSLIETTYGKHAEKLAEIQAKQEALAAKETERKDKLSEALNLELAINEAKAAGDTELVNALENQKLFNAELQKAIDAGMGEPQARAFAQQMVNAKNAAAAISDKNVVVTVTTTVDDTAYKNLLASLAVNADPKTIAVALEVTGKDNLNEAYATLQNMELINKNYQAAFTAIGASSIEEVLANLEGIPTESQRQLAMKITGEEDFDRAVRKLDSFGGSKEVKLLLQSQGFESMDSFQNQLNGIVGDKRTDLILESFGVEDVESAKDALEAILANNGKKATITAEADTTPAEQKIAELSDKTATVPLDGDTSPLQSSLSAFTATAQKLTLDAADSIAAIRTALAEPITMNLDGSGNGGSSNEGGVLSGLVSDIKGLLTELNRKLPSPVLT